jgi:hypothetical protein
MLDILSAFPYQIESRKILAQYEIEIQILEKCFIYWCQSWFAWSCNRSWSKIRRSPHFHWAANDIILISRKCRIELDQKLGKCSSCGGWVKIMIIILTCAWLRKSMISSVAWRGVARIIIHQQYHLLINKSLIWQKFVKIKNEDMHNIVLKISTLMSEFCFDFEIKSIPRRMRSSSKWLRRDLQPWNMRIYEVRDFVTVEIQKMIEIYFRFCCPMIYQIIRHDKWHKRPFRLSVLSIEYIYFIEVRKN